MKDIDFADDLMNSPAYLKAAAEKKQREDVAKAKSDLHKCLTVTLNKLIAPWIVQRCWNYAMDDRPISYAQSAALCLGVACVKSFATFSLSDV